MKWLGSGQDRVLKLVHSARETHESYPVRGSLIDED